MSENLYRWALSADGKWWVLNDDKNFVVRTKPTPNKGYVAVGHKRFAYHDTIEEGQALVEGLYDHYSLPAFKRWLTL